MTNEQLICAECGVEIPKKTGGYFDNVLVCDTCYEEEMNGEAIVELPEEEDDGGNVDFSGGLDRDEVIRQ